MSYPAISESQTVARQIIDACAAIAQFSETPGSLTRTYLSAPFHDVHEFLRAWMRRLGMTSHVDAAGNLRGLYSCQRPQAPRLLIGSHIDTVPDAGAYDGVLGVVIALALIENLTENLAYDIEVDCLLRRRGCPLCHAVHRQPHAHRRHRRRFASQQTTRTE